MITISQFGSFSSKRENKRDWVGFFLFCFFLSGNFCIEYPVTVRCFCVENNSGPFGHTEAVETGKLTNEMFGPLSIGGSCAFGSDTCLARIHSDRVVFAS